MPRRVPRPTAPNDAAAEGDALSGERNRLEENSLHCLPSVDYLSDSQTHALPSLTFDSAAVEANALPEEPEDKRPLLSFK